ncbi:hypothetical protein FHR90_003267 [Endobacter medicaginis]|uniref:Lipoprotein n=1 Tax=Endobacter medicaginis TaxID=1181271 RepID=A0A850NNX7_9PROT|nr:hypothetical protein [Endobacter medicaginis]MBB3175412.1 hypothetical protein [Endobacter medicaginis]MCX5476883.1 hypothetical protein [Endobacter medicaginis]NVN29576.1 hypothetical protein [Endobacter medicaginis]
MRRLVAFAAVLTTAGCTQTTNPDGSMRFSLNPSQLFQQQNLAATGGDMDGEALANVTAKRLAADRTAGGMAQATSDITSCYQSASMPAEMRQCMALDTVTMQSDVLFVVAMQQKFHHPYPTMPFFNQADNQARMSTQRAVFAFGSVDNWTNWAMKWRRPAALYAQAIVSGRAT